MMNVKSSLLVTAAVAVTALVLEEIFSSSNLTSVYAKPTDPRFCYTFTGSTGPEGRACFYTMGDCKKGEAQFVSEGGGTVEQH